MRSGLGQSLLEISLVLSASMTGLISAYSPAGAVSVRTSTGVGSLLSFSQRLLARGGRTQLFAALLLRAESTKPSCMAVRLAYISLDKYVLVVCLRQFATLSPLSALPSPTDRLLVFLIPAECFTVLLHRSWPPSAGECRYSQSLGYNVVISLNAGHWGCFGSLTFPDTESTCRVEQLSNPLMLTFFHFASTSKWVLL